MNGPMKDGNYFFKQIGNYSNKIFFIFESSRFSFTKTTTYIHDQIIGISLYRYGVIINLANFLHMLNEALR